VQLSEARELVVLTLEQGGIVNLPPALIDRIINEAIARFSARKPSLFERWVYYIGTDADTAEDNIYGIGDEISFASEFKTIDIKSDLEDVANNIDYTLIQVLEVMRDGERMKYSPTTAMNNLSYERMYAVDSNFKIYFNDTVSTSAHIAVKYSARPNPISADDDAIPLPYEFELMPVYYAVQHFAVDNGNKLLAESYGARFAQLFAEAIRYQTSNGSFQIKPASF